jgi:hypothetical protein
MILVSRILATLGCVEAFIVMRGDGPSVPSAELHVHSECLEVAANNVSAVVRGRRKHTERNRVDSSGAQCTVPIQQPPQFA